MSEDRPQPPVPAEWRSRLLELPRLNKRIILVALDFLLLTLALWISISIRYNTAYVPPDWYTALVLISGPGHHRHDLRGVRAVPLRHALSRLSRPHAHHRLHLAVGADLVAGRAHVGPARHPALGGARLWRSGDAAHRRQPRGGRHDPRERRHSPLRASGQHRAHAGHHLRCRPSRRAAAGGAAAQLQSHGRRLHRHRAVPVAAVRRRPEGASPRQAADAYRPSRREGDPRRHAGRSAARASAHPQGSAGASRSR